MKKNHNEMCKALQKMGIACANTVIKKILEWRVAISNQMQLECKVQGAVGEKPG